MKGIKNKDVWKNRDGYISAVTPQAETQQHAQATRGPHGENPLQIAAILEEDGAPKVVYGAANFCHWVIHTANHSFQDSLVITAEDGIKEGKSYGLLWSKRVADNIHIQEGGVLASFEGHSTFNTEVDSVSNSQLSNGDNQDMCHQSR